MEPVLKILPTIGISRSRDVVEYMGWAWETWILWKKAGLEVIDDIGTNAEQVDLATLHGFLTSRPELPKRPSRKKPK